MMAMTTTVWWCPKGRGCKGGGGGVKNDGEDGDICNSINRNKVNKTNWTEMEMVLEA